jgi:hypothetical protein
MQMLDFKMIEKHTCSKLHCVGYTFTRIKPFSNHCEVFINQQIMNWSSFLPLRLHLLNTILLWQPFLPSKTF